MNNKNIKNNIKKAYKLDVMLDVMVLLYLMFLIWYLSTKITGDVYDHVIAVALSLALWWIGRYWRLIHGLLVGTSLCAVFTLYLYGHNPQSFWLNYWLSSQAASLWMSVLIAMAWLLYAGSFKWRLLGWLASTLTTSGIFAGFVAIWSRWIESHVLHSDLGRIPVSNLYEVFLLFIPLTTLCYVYYEQRYRTRSLGVFALLVVCAAIVFFQWYGISRNAAVITPLTAALNSWWMTLHVPANFIGYGAFAIAAMVGFAYLIKQDAIDAMNNKPKKLSYIAMLVLGGLLLAEPLIFARKHDWQFWLMAFGASLIIVALVLWQKKAIATKLPSLEMLDEIMYKAIALGFVFFTLATVLGALWAADAWGTYWQWDPKETWALIVWLNYATWLHWRILKGWRGSILAYWSLIGLIVTSFAFLGVNLYLSGLHSYGEL